MFTAQMDIKVSGIGAATIQKSITATGGGVALVSETIAGEETDLEIAFDLDKSATTMFVMTATGPLTIKTNSSSEPQETITIAADGIIPWAEGEDGFTSPFADDVTKLFVTNAELTDAVLSIQAVYDVTP